MSEPPVLLACAHGTRAEAGQATYRALAAAVSARRPQLQVVGAYVDVQEPTLDAAVEDLTSAGRSLVVVPLLLSSGYHVGVDVPRAILDRPGARAARPLGPDPVLADLLTERLDRCGLDRDATVVLAAAGSSDEAAAVDVGRMAELLAERRGARVEVAYAADVEPRLADVLADVVADVVAAVRAGGSGPAVGVGVGVGVGVASYLLAPGYFQSVVERVGREVGALVTGPLCRADEVDPRLVDLVLDRYDAVVAAG